jgi:gluconolactonase
LERQQVYLLKPGTGEVRAVAEDLVQPNGIIGSPDGRTLYIADIGDGKTYSYTIGNEGSLSGKTLFCSMGSDGMTLDNMGNLYLTGDGVTVYNMQGEKILHIPVPQKWTANVTFGGTEMNTLFITAMNSVYTLEMKVHGMH